MPVNRSEIARFLYSCLWTGALPLVMARLWWKGRKQPEYRQHLAERFGRYAHAQSAACLWLHAVSVGETRAAAPLVKALRGAYPDHQIILTHMTPTGRATGTALYGDHDPMVRSVYLPYDLPWLHRRFLRHFSPALGIVMETEVWPNLMAECERRRLPVALVNARLSERSGRRYATMGALAHSTFGRFALVAAQSSADAQRLSALGAPGPAVTGNIKFDNHPKPEQLALGDAFRTKCGERPVVLAASTREGEEAELIHSARPLVDAGALLVIVPRHPQRFDEVATMATRAGYRVGRRSQVEQPDENLQVWIGDSMGEMTAYYQMADLTLMGGTWQPLGGQNFIECCAVGTPVLLGPSTFNFSEAADQALRHGAARRCANLPDALALCQRLLDDRPALETMGQAGLGFARQHGGATDRTLALLQPLITS